VIQRAFVVGLTPNPQRRNGLVSWRCSLLANSQASGIAGDNLLAALRRSIHSPAA